MAEEAVEFGILQGVTYGGSARPRNATSRPQEDSTDSG
jgi:hypothetical protein